MANLPKPDASTVNQRNHRPSPPPASVIRRDSISTNEAFAFWFPQSGSGAK